jgi:catechol 2,3-dioxygenase-like lactoylglutathione lyase family enzyme
VAVELNHTIVRVRNKVESATFYSDILGTATAEKYGPFLVLELANGVSLDFADDHGTQPATHYAFLVSENEFDQILGRITDRGLTYWADPSHRQVGVINHNDGGRGVYWDDPDGNNLEIITRPYGGA